MRPAERTEPTTTGVEPSPSSDASRRDDGAESFPDDEAFEEETRWLLEEEGERREDSSENDTDGESIGKFGSPEDSDRAAESTESESGEDEERPGFTTF